MRKEFAFLGVIATLLGGCATQNLAIRPYTTASTGSPYQLNFTQFTVKAKWRLKTCAPFKVTVEASATSAMRPDPTARYMLDSSSLEGWFNTATVTTTYDENGNFKTLNATIDDKTVEGVTAIGKGIVQAVVLAGLLTAPPGCQDLVDDAENAEKAAKLASEDLEKYRKEILRVQADPTLREPERERRLKQMRGTLELKESDAATATKNLEKALKGVTFEETFAWPNNGGEVSDVHWLAGDSWNLWTKDLPVKPAVGLGLTLSLQDGGVVGHDATKLVLTRGLPIRLPHPGKLLVERVQGPNRTTLNVRDKVTEAEVQLIQSGDILYVPVQRRPMTSTTASVGLHPNGQLASIGRGQTSAPGETFGKLLDAVATQGKALKETEKTELEKLQEENTLLQARKTNADLLKALNPTEADLELGAINAELTLTTAKVNLIKAQQTLATLPTTP